MERATDPRIVRVLEVMHQQFACPWRVSQLAALADLSPSRFAHLFETHVGVAPLRYLRHLRLDRARMLLERTSTSVAEVMRSVGYGDASHFSKDFRRRFGTGPREHRRDCRAASGRYPAADDRRSPSRGDLPGHGRPPWKNPSE
jgi:AraC family transcriptional regulator of arabinose operon